MSKIYKGVSELIGKTPIIEAVNFEKAVEADATILASSPYAFSTCVSSTSGVFPISPNVP